MNKVFLVGFQVFLFSSLCSAEATMLRSGSFREVLRSVGSIIKSSGAVSGVFENLAPSVLMSKIALLIHNGFEDSKKIEDEANIRDKQRHELLGRKKSYEEICQERAHKIKELRKEILEARYSLTPREGQSLEDMLAELADLLEKPAELEIGSEENKMLLWDSKSELFKQPTPINNFIVPGMRMAPAKKSDRSVQKGSEKTASLASAQEESEVLQPVSASVAPPGSTQITIPTVVLPLAVFQQLQTENAFLRNENAELKQQIQIIYKRDVEKLQSEVTRLERDNDQLRRDINLLREENEILRRENQELKERLAVLERELGDTQKTLGDTQNALGNTQKELGDTKKALSKLQLSHDTLKERFDRHQYMLEIGQALGYINDEIRRVFNDPASPGFPGTQRMARRNEFRDDEPRIWADFVRAHPGADNIAFAGIFADIMLGRVGLMHPTHVDQMDPEELKRRILAVKPELQESVTQSFVDFVYTFSVPERW